MGIPGLITVQEIVIFSLLHSQRKEVSGPSDHHKKNTQNFDSHLTLFDLFSLGQELKTRDR